ncbi:MAG: hypothetical protein ACJ76V_13570 [Thermoleophilaceae bacterium]
MRRASWLAIAVCVVVSTGVDTGGALRRAGKKPKQPATAAPAAVTKRGGYELTAAGASPVAGRPWQAAVSGPDGGQVSFDVVGFDEKLGHIGNGEVTGGRFAAKLTWPRAAVGYPLVLQASVQTGKGTVTLTYPLRVRSS